MKSHRTPKKNGRKNSRPLGKGQVSVYAPEDLPESVMAVLRVLHPHSKFTKKA